jgi:hypothetical protein
MSRGSDVFDLRWVHSASLDSGEQNSARSHLTAGILVCEAKAKREKCEAQVRSSKQLSWSPQHRSRTQNMKERVEGVLRAQSSRIRSANICRHEVHPPEREAIAPYSTTLPSQSSKARPTIS